MKKRIAIFILSFIFIYAFNFYIQRLMPGDPFAHSETTGGNEMEGLSLEDIERMKAYYGLDKPINEQFIDTIKGNIKGDFGNSILYKKPVTEVISKRFPWTFFIMFFTLIISLLIGVFMAGIGIYNSKLNKIIHRVMTSVCEIPSFIVGVLLLFLVAAKVKWIPLSGNLTPFKQYTGKLEYIWDVFKHSLMPITTLVIINVPNFYFTAVSSFETILNKQYIMNGYSKGLSKRRKLIKYIMLNAILPITARFFLSVGNTIGATMIIENVFAYPGLGRILRDAVIFRDFILIQGIFLVSTTTVLVSSFISDSITEFVSKYNT